MNRAQQLVRSLPAGLYDIAGNRNVQEFFVQAVTAGGEIDNALIIGDSGTGKTSGALLFLSTLRCLSRDEAVLGPCGACARCRNNHWLRFEHGGVFAFLEHPDRPLSVLFYRCSSLSLDKLAILENTILPACTDAVFVILDEVQSLNSDRLCGRLIEIMDRQVEVVWIATGTDTKGLEKAFVKRFATGLRTERPQTDQYVDFLDRRARAHGIVVTDREALQVIAERSECIPRTGLQLLSRAFTEPGSIMTVELARTAGLPLA